MINKKKIIAEADYFLNHETTLRQMSNVFSRSKSAIHKDLTLELPKINQQKYKLVQAHLTENKRVSHIKGGESTKRKYELLK